MPTYVKKYRKKPAFTRSSRGVKRVRGRTSVRDRRRKWLSKPSTRYLGPLVPDKCRTKLKYSAELKATVNAGTIGLYLFNANSIFDPDQTGTGHQPLGHDEFADFYHYYRVTGCAIKITAFQSTGTGTGTVYQPFRYTLVAAPEQNGIWAVTNPNTIAEQPGAVSRLHTSQDGKAAILRKYMSTAKVMGRNPTQVKNDDDFGALVGANPADAFTWQYGLFMDMVDTSFATGVVIVFVAELTYYTEFFQRRSLGSS